MTAARIGRTEPSEPPATAPEFAASGAELDPATSVAAATTATGESVAAAGGVAASTAVGVGVGAGAVGTAVTTGRAVGAWVAHGWHRITDSPAAPAPDLKAPASRALR